MPNRHLINQSANGPVRHKREIRGYGFREFRFRENGLCLFDGQCRFCRASVGLALKLKAHCEFLAWQDCEVLPDGVTAEQCAREVVFVDAHGAISGGAAAVAQILRTTRLKQIAGIIDAPFMLPISEGIYKWVARHRGQIPVRGYCAT